MNKQPSKDFLDSLLSLNNSKKVITLNRALAQSAVTDFDIYMEEGRRQFSFHEMHKFELVKNSTSDQLLRLSSVYPEVVFAYLEWVGLEHPQLSFNVTD
ncbi:hypothetical protein LIS04_98 [Listeria phage LIS04]|nr:hypothetical protein LIS04_98 [Listeria phage LIS04]